MRKFIRNIILFSLPIIVYLGVTIIPFYYAGKVTFEIADIDECIAFQRENPDALYGMGYSDSTSFYKLENANYYKAPIISLGTSRVMQIKNDYFVSEFYNCGGAVAGNYNEYKNFLENLSYKPDVIILGLDSWVFNDWWNSMCSDYSSFVEISRNNINPTSIIKRIRDDWLDDKWKFSQLNDYNNMGFNGNINDSGFMLDGSYYYGDVYRNPEIQEDYNFADTLDRIAIGTKRFEYGEHIDIDTITQLDNLLSYCKENDIYVIAFLPPFAPTIYNAMIESNNYGYLNEISPTCKELFAKYNYSFYDYLDVSNFLITDDYFVDGFHGSEVVYAYIIRDMSAKDTVLSNYVNEKILNVLIDESFDGRTFYEPDKRYEH